MVLSPPCSFRTPEVWATGRSRCHHTFAANRGLLPCCSLGSVFTTGLCATLTTEGAALSSTGARRYSVPSPQAVTSLSRLNPPPQTLSTAEERPIGAHAPSSGPQLPQVARHRAQSKMPA